MAGICFGKGHHSRKEHHSLGSSGSILTPTQSRYKVSQQATVLSANMPGEHVPNIPIPLPITLYVIPLVIMAEYLVQQLWALVRQSLESEEDLTPPSSSPSPLPSSSSSEEENSSITGYVTPSASPSPILPVRMLNKGKQQEETPLTSPKEPVTILPCLICCFKNHSLEDCPDFPKIPTVVVKDFSLLCILCDKAGHELKGCPQYRCPICLRPALGHSNNSCPNSLVDPSSDEEDL